MKRSFSKILIFLLLLPLTVSLVNSVTLEIGEIPPLQKATFPLYLHSNTKCSGAITILGGSGDIDFYVTDPAGNRILDLGRVRNGAGFEFTSSVRGTYVLHFDNQFSQFDAKQVRLYYDIDILPLVLTIVFWIVLIAIPIIIIVLLYRRKQKKLGYPIKNY